MIPRIAPDRLVRLFGRAFKVGARQVIEQHVKSRPKQIPPLVRQMLFQASFVLDHPVQGTIKPVFLRHSRITVQQQVHRRLPKPLLVNEQFTARGAQAVDRQ